MRYLISMVFILASCGKDSEQPKTNTTCVAIQSGSVISISIKGLFGNDEWSYMGCTLTELFGDNPEIYASGVSRSNVCQFNFGDDSYTITMNHPNASILGTVEHIDSNGNVKDGWEVVSCSQEEEAQ